MIQQLQNQLTREETRQDFPVLSSPLYKEVRIITKYKVKCVTRESNPDYPDCRSIAEIGFPGKNQPVVTESPSEVYDMIEDGDKVVVEYQGDETEVQQATTEDGTKYVRTEPNDTKEDNLLKQDACPV